jgi:hypothetical protein
MAQDLSFAKTPHEGDSRPCNMSRGVFVTCALDFGEAQDCRTAGNGPGRG